MDSPDTRTDVTYLGDGAYVGLEDGVIIVYTSDLQDLLAKIGSPCP